MKKRAISICAVLVLNFQNVNGQIAYLTFGTGTQSTPQTLTVAPGSSFTTEVLISFSGISAGGISYDLYSSNSNLLSLTNRDYIGTGSPMAFLSVTDLTTTNATLFPDGASIILNPSTGFDLGGLTTGATTSGTYFVSDLTFTVSASANLGNYSLGILPGNGSELTSSDFTTNIELQSSGLNIDVVPEPSMNYLLGLGLVAALFVGGLRRRLLS